MVESYCKLSGAISEKDTVPWKLMVWREAELSYISNRLSLSPPDYVSIVGPPLSGRSTLVNQLANRWSEPPIPLVFSRIRLPELSRSSTANCLRILSEAILVDVQENLPFLHPEAPSVEYPTVESHEPIVFRDWLISLMDSMPQGIGLAIVLEDVNPFAEIDNLILSEMQALYLRRRDSGLGLFTVITTSMWLLSVDHGNFVSPFNDAQEVLLSGFSAEETVAFGERVAKAANRKWDRSALEYIHHTVGGHPGTLADLLCSRGCAGMLNMETARKAMLPFLLGDSRFARLVLNRGGFSPEAIELIKKLISGKAPLAYHSLPEVAQLAASGVISDREDWCRFSSQLVTWLCAIKYGTRYELRAGSELEEIISQLPTTQMLLANSNLRNSLQREARETLKREGPNAQELMIVNALLDQVRTWLGAGDVDLPLLQAMVESVSPDVVATLDDPAAAIADTLTNLVAFCWSQADA